MEIDLPRPAGRIASQPGKVHLARRRAPLVVGICAASPAGLNTVRRAALVASALEADLKILHSAPQGRATSCQDRSVRELADQIGQDAGLNVAVEAVQSDLLGQAVALSRDAAVVVLPSSRGNPLGEWIMGTQAERLIRLCRSPVLVVKRPVLLAYGRVLVPLDIDDMAVRLIDLAASLSRSLRLTVLHAIDGGDDESLQGMNGSGEAARSWQQHRARGAFLALQRFIAAAQPGAVGADAAIEFGGAAPVVLARASASDTELMVIGKSQRGLLADYFLGGLTQRVLAQARSDVLVHPSRQQRDDAPCAATDQGSCMS